jgi:hypothetical protein
MYTAYYVKTFIRTDTQNSIFCCVDPPTSSRGRALCAAPLFPFSRFLARAVRCDDVVVVVGL